MMATRPTTPLFPRGQVLAFGLVTLLFFLWGMSNSLTDILVQQFRKSLGLTQAKAQLVQTAVFLGYFLMALPAASAMRRRGYKYGILLGLGLFSLGTLLFWPAAQLGQYWMLLSALFLVGCGSATIETAANPFIAEMGLAETAARRLNFAQAFNPPGTIAGVLVGAYCIFSGVELSPAQVATYTRQGIYKAYQHTELLRVVPPYVGLGIGVLLLALLIAFAPFPTTSPEADPGKEPLLAQLRLLLGNPKVRSAVVAQFFYCGAQVATWSVFIPYLKQYTGFPERTAAWLLTGNLIALAAGRIVSTVMMRWFRPMRMLAVYSGLNLALVLLAIALPGRTGAAALLASSFFMSIMFPTIFAAGVQNLGERTKLAGSLLVMSILGGGLIPPVAGYLAGVTGSYALSYLTVLLCYAAVARFALRFQRLHSSGDA